MTPEDQLDRAIDARFAGRLVSSTDHEVLERLRVAKMMAQVNEITVPQDFADQLQSRLLARLGERRSHTQRITLPLLSGRYAVTVARSWLVVAVIVILVAVTTFSVSNVAASSLPGDPLYHVKQLQQQVVLSQADSPTNKAQLAIDQLNSSVSDLTAIVDQKRDDEAILGGIASIADHTHTGQMAVDAVPSGQDHDSLAVSLATAINQEKKVLYQLLNAIDWRITLALSGQLGVLDEPVPTISSVMVHIGSNTVTLTVNGTNFRAGVQITINGIIEANAVTAQQPLQLTAQIPIIIWLSDQHAIGVVNTDGTASQYSIKSGEIESDHSTTPTIVPNSEGGQVPGTSMTPTPANGDDGTYKTPTPGSGGGGSIPKTPTPGGSGPTPTPGKDG